VEKKLRTRVATVALAIFAKASLSACGGGERVLDAIDQGAHAPLETTKTADMPAGRSADQVVALPSSPVAAALPTRASNPVASSSGGPSIPSGAPLIAGVEKGSPDVSGVKSTSTSLIQASASTPASHSLPMSSTDFQMVSMPFGTAHEGIPAGVPVGYDWRLTSKLRVANRVPAGYKAFTGWAQVFSVQGSDPGSHQSIEIRNHQTLMCTWENGQPVWRRVQAGGIAGAVFPPDFSGNVNSPAATVEIAPETLRVGFPVNMAYHFWPRQGRIDLPSVSLCGHLVLLEARAVKPNGQALAPTDQPALLIGVGADYWLTRTAPYDRHLTNVPSASGQLRLVTAGWQWFGMSVADPAELAALQIQGFRLGVAS
jgi:hypothetical protein